MNRFGLFHHHYPASEFQVHNPHRKLLSELPVIYGFNNGNHNGDMGDFHGVVLAEDGTELGGHISSCESWMIYDLGLLNNASQRRRDQFRAHYPEGYRCEFVSYEGVPNHQGLRAAMQRAYEARSETA